MRRLEEDEGRGLPGDARQKLRPVLPLARRETKIDDGVGGQAREDERRHRRRWARQDLDPDAPLDAGRDEAVTGVGDERHPGIRDQGQAQRMRTFGELSCQAVFVVFVEGDEVALYLVVGEQAAGAAGVLAGYEVGLAQVAKGPEGDVLEVAYGGWDDSQGHR